MNVHPGAKARPKGPLVFLDMDQQALDEAYDQEIWAPNRALIVERRKAASERARAILGMPKRVAYGAGEHEWGYWDRKIQDVLGLITQAR